MYAQLSIINQDELVGSLIYRYTTRMGITDDKVLLEHLFENRKIVPSGLFQGHLSEFLNVGGKNITCSTTELAEKHTLLPLFKPFIPEQRYKQLVDDLAYSRKSTFTYRSGFNASVVQYPKFYKVCPQCFQQQKAKLGYAYAQRVLQCPGVEFCPIHGLPLTETEISIISAHKHRFTGVDSNLKFVRVTLIHANLLSTKLLDLALLVQQLLYPVRIHISYCQWTRFYQKLAIDNGLMIGNRVDHCQIKNLVEEFWSIPWLTRQSLIVSETSSWLVDIFRKHRKSFSYLQHFIVWFALDYIPKNLKQTLIAVSQLQDEPKNSHVYNQCQDEAKLNEYRRIWLSLIKRKSLKQVRATTEGCRVYSWLYRYDNFWLKNNKPKSIVNYVNERVNWLKRDIYFAKSLLKILFSVEGKLNGPRRSAAWFATQFGEKALLGRKLDKLPLCQQFFIKYTETVDEYQQRRLAFYLSKQINNNILIGCISDVERAVGINKKRVKEHTREIIKMELPTWKRNQKISSGCNLAVHRENIG
ncbi:TnsD family Tn7-like transposition protein [Catenovulum sediminis]|uniref:TnsD family Tn7-like transposition protein n=1 Tax=Catenovulum sediminis TaxID=1740262 RepID=A0ABV1RJH7_9ALTE